MSLPYRVSDAIEFLVLETGEYVEVTDPATGIVSRQYVDAGAQPVIEGGDRYERTIDVLLRADPANQAIAGADTPDGAIIFVGDATRQAFPLRPNESLNVRVSRRSAIYFRAGSRDETGAETGAPGAALRLHVVTAVLNVGSISS